MHVNMYMKSVTVTKLCHPKGDNSIYLILNQNICLKSKIKEQRLFKLQ